ncbi:MAG: dTMP kinase [Proteobacteria bacterium]|nr:dTMP kinase [Burkholderiales bacterium]
MNKSAGRFITLEGVDGAGKSTHIEFIAGRLRAQSAAAVVVTREPGGTQVGERLRELVLAESMHPETETLAIFAARAEHLLQVVRPALRAGSTVLCDRFTDATRAYQCGGRGVAESFVDALARLTQGDLQPDLTLLFDLDATVAQQRVEARRPTDRFEQEGRDFFDRVRARYLEQARREPDRFRILDAAGSVADVQAAIVHALDPQTRR